MIEKLKRWNPWWSDGKVPENRLGIKRDILPQVQRLLKPREIVVITGVRRSGKSTVLFQLIDSLLEKTDPKNILYFNFDETLDHNDERALDAVYNLYLETNNAKGKKYVFFDEIQNIQGWERWIKKNYDLYNTEIKFVLTGSNNSMIYTNLSKLLTGRMLTKTIFPLSFREFLNFKKVDLKDIDLQAHEIRHHFARYLCKGGFPETTTETDDYIKDMRLKEYFDSILLRDIVQPNQIREVAKLVELAHYCSTNIGSIASYNNISKTIGLNITSLKEYLKYMEDAYLIFQLRFFSYSLKESLMIQKPRKLYCIDNGLRNTASFIFSKDEGRLAENLVFLELKRQEKEAYYWKGKYEVDFVVKNSDNSLTAINVYHSDSVSDREVKGLTEFKEGHRACKELILITKSLEQKKEVRYVPLWRWLLET